MFTINNYTRTDLDQLSTLIALTNGPCYVCAGKETAPTTGTPHLQCFACWPTRDSGGQRWSWLRKRLTRAADIQMMYSTRTACVDYVTKAGDVLEWGTRPPMQQGKRTDLEGARLMLEEGMPMRSVASAHFGSFCRYHKAFEKYAAMQVEPRSWKPTVYWLFGSAGTGKTRWAHAKFPDNCCLEYQNNFWSDYHGQENVILDDYCHSDHKEETICRMIDRYPFKLRIIGGYADFVPRNIVITSNYPPPDSHRMSRRIDHVLSFPLSSSDDFFIEFSDDMESD